MARLRFVERMVIAGYLAGRKGHLRVRSRFVPRNPHAFLPDLQVCACAMFASWFLKTAAASCSGRILHPEEDGGSNKSPLHMRASCHSRRSSRVADAKDIERLSEVHVPAELLVQLFSSCPLRQDGRPRVFPSTTIFWRGMLPPCAVTTAAYDFICTLC